MLRCDRAAFWPVLADWPPSLWAAALRTSGCWAGFSQFAHCQSLLFPRHVPLWTGRATGAVLVSHHIGLQPPSLVFSGLAFPILSFALLSTHLSGILLISSYPLSQTYVSDTTHHVFDVHYLQGTMWEMVLNLWASISHSFWIPLWRFLFLCMYM